MSDNPQHNNQIEQMQDDIEIPFFERPFEEVEDGYIDDRGFYTTLNGSFWDNDHTYFNSFGFDKHGGTYDKYGVYHPGPGYDEKLGIYNDQKELFPKQEENNNNEIEHNFINKLKEEEKENELIIKNYEKPEEQSDSDYDEYNSNNVSEEIEEVYKYTLEGINNSDLDKYKNNEKLIGINIKQFLSKIDLIKNTVDYKKKGPYIFCAVTRDINPPAWLRDISPLLNKLNNYHAGIFEATKKLLIHYGEPDENDIKKPLGIESINDDAYLEYSVVKYFYSKIEPYTFLNLIDKNDWTTERYALLKHNCIHCVNEYLQINNIRPIPFGLGRDIAYEYLCENCIKNLGRYNMYLKLEKKFNLSKAFFNLDADNFETIPIKFDIEQYKEYEYKCQKCLCEPASWLYNYNWLQVSEEEWGYYNPKIEHAKNHMEELKNFEIVGESLCDALIKVKIKNMPKYKYAIIRKNLFVKREDKQVNYGFAALASLHENTIIEYGNEKYNNGGPVLREINEEDKYIYHTVRLFNINENANEVFNSINLSPWKPERYDSLYYSSYNFINIFLYKYNQKLFLIKSVKKFNSAFLHLCKECYKNLNCPDCYRDIKG